MKENGKNMRQPGSDGHPGDAEKKFPGYPSYPASEDIMFRGERIDADVNVAFENIQRLKSATPEASFTGTNEPSSDLTKEDFQALASEELHANGDDEILINRAWPVDFAAEDLDIPGSEDDDLQESVGSEDEENNSYSIGGDRHEDLEEDHA